MPSPASRVIDRFGGQSNLARLIEKNPSTVQYWSNTGRIPAKWHARLLELAAEAEVDELMVTTFLADKADRVRTITSLAAALGLLNRSLMSAGV